MNVKLAIDRLREHAREDPDSFTVVDVPPGVTAVRSQISVPNVYTEFLRETNGPRFGVIGFWADQELDGKQQVLRDLLGSLVEGRFVFGQVSYEPLVLDVNRDLVLGVSPNPGASTPESRIEALTVFDEFLEEFVLGGRYAELLTMPAEQEWWWQMLGRLGLR